MCVLSALRRNASCAETIRKWRFTLMGRLLFTVGTAGRLQDSWGLTERADCAGVVAGEAG